MDKKEKIKLLKEKIKKGEYKLTDKLIDATVQSMINRVIEKGELYGRNH